MKAKVLKSHDSYYGIVNVGDIVHIAPNMAIETKSLNNTIYNLCYLCMTVSGNIFYIPATWLQIVFDEPIIEWECRRVEIYKKLMKLSWGMMP